MPFSRPIPALVLGLALAAPAVAQSRDPCVDAMCMEGWGGHLEFGLGSIAGRPAFAERLGIGLDLPVGIAFGAAFDPTDGGAGAVLFLEAMHNLWRSDGRSGSSPGWGQSSLHIDAVLGLASAGDLPNDGALSIGLAARLHWGPIYLAMRPHVVAHRVRDGDLQRVFPTAVLELNVGFASSGILSDVEACGTSGLHAPVPVLRPP